MGGYLGAFLLGTIAFVGPTCDHTACTREGFGPIHKLCIYIQYSSSLSHSLHPYSCVALRGCADANRTCLAVVPHAHAGVHAFMQAANACIQALVLNPALLAPSTHTPPDRRQRRQEMLQPSHNRVDNDSDSASRMPGAVMVKTVNTFTPLCHHTSRDVSQHNDLVKCQHSQRVKKATHSHTRCLLKPALKKRRPRTSLPVGRVRPELEYPTFTKSCEKSLIGQTVSASS